MGGNSPGRYSGPTPFAPQNFMPQWQSNLAPQPMQPPRPNFGVGPQMPQMQPPIVPQFFAPPQSSMPQAQPLPQMTQPLPQAPQQMQPLPQPQGLMVQPGYNFPLSALMGSTSYGR